MFDSITDRALKRRIKQHVIGREHLFFASVQPGFEKTLEKELASFGLNVSGEHIEGGGEFRGSLDDCFTACIRSRTASRVLMRIAEFRSHDFYELERGIRGLSWELYLNPEFPVRFSITSRKSMIYHTGKLEEIFRRQLPPSYKFEENGSGGGEVPVCQTLFVRNFRDTCTVSIDASGEFLYRRGVKQLVGAAPLRETLASLILLEAGVEKYDIILDPMCGSGTFSIEAASILTSTPPNIERNFPFMNWPSFKEKNYEFMKKEILKLQNRDGIKGRSIITSDIDPDAVETASGNVPDLFREVINPEQGDFFNIAPSFFSGGKVIVVLNPPYGKRLREKDPAMLYRMIGEKIKKDFNNCGYALIAPGIEAEAALNLNCSRKIPFMNGGIKAALLIRDI